jgi:hypothetical protein
MASALHALEACSDVNPQIRGLDVHVQLFALAWLPSKTPFKFSLPEF